MSDTPPLAASFVAAGLSQKEAAIYLDLLQHGESRTGKLCERTRIPSSAVYALLDGLLQKGLVTYKLVNNVKAFSATAPENLVHLFDEKEEQLLHEKQALLSSISQLKKLPLSTHRLNDFKYFEGIRGVKSLYTEIAQGWKPGDEYCVASAPSESFRKLEGFFLDVVHAKRIADRVRLRIIIDEGGREYGAARAKMPFTDVRYIAVDTATEYGVLNDLVWLVAYGDSPYGLLIKDQNFAASYQAFFEILWNAAKP